MCFSAVEERPGGVLALPNGFLKAIVARRYGDELGRYAESAGFERIAMSWTRRSLLAPLTSSLLPSDARSLPRLPGSSRPV